MKKTFLHALAWSVALPMMLASVALITGQGSDAPSSATILLSQRRRPVSTPTPMPTPTPIPYLKMTVLSPNGGEVLALGVPYRIRWKYENINATTTHPTVLALQTHDIAGGYFREVLRIANSVPTAVGENYYDWTPPITSAIATNYRIAVEVTQLQRDTVGWRLPNDNSDADFSLTDSAVMPTPTPTARPIPTPTPTKKPRGR